MSDRGCYLPEGDDKLASEYSNAPLEGFAVSLEQLLQWQQKPAPFTPGEPLFWDDPYISGQMLAAHLDPCTDTASRRLETIDHSVAWLVETQGLHSGDAVLDLGCGPGLYAARLAERGLRVTGVDFSRSSIDYARRYAQEKHLDIVYRLQDYLTIEDERAFDVVLLIYGDFCPLAPEQRSFLLRNIHRALKIGGYFILDVTTRRHREKHGIKNAWYVAENGFWRPGRHLVLELGFDYPEHDLYLDQYIVVETRGKPFVYRNWFQDYNRESITAELSAGHFEVCGIWGDLTGALWTEDGEWLGIMARRN